MLPSDHFVRFYNEIFKFLEKQGKAELEKYYKIVADRQAYFVLEQFKRDGFKGMFDYWERINIEENCDLRGEYDENHYHSEMVSCPSVAKAIDNDAGPCRCYCDHCPGWVLDVLARAGFYGVYDIVSRTDVKCSFWAFKDRALAQAKYDELVRLRGGADLVKNNWTAKAGRPEVAPYQSQQ